MRWLLAEYIVRWVVVPAARLASMIDPVHTTIEEV